ncbi:MAG: glycosyltransferase family 2 protein [Chloroflexi bacterium]|nr:glycosyltransferase family 2 protein [Chloroflexota bacterium]
MIPPLLSVVIPTRHEARTVGPFLHQLQTVLSGTDFEIIVVDDSDRDNTLEVLLDVQRELGSQRLVVLHRPRGSVAERTLGTAVVAGIRAARGVYVCVMDADGQHPPEAIPPMLAAAQQAGADYVGGSRYLPGGSPQGLNGTSRKAISLGLALLTRLAFLLTPVRRVTDPLSGFFLFRRSLVQGVQLKPIGWKISLEVLVRGRARRVTEIPYTFLPRADGESKACMQQGLLVLRHILMLLLSLTGVQRFALFGLVGLSGMLVNTGTLLTLQALGSGELGWPLWVATEVAILWNYLLNRRLTWRDRPYSTWWLYNLAALGASGVAITITTLLLLSGQVTLWLASISGILAGMCLNYVVLDSLVFSGLAWLAVQTRVPRVHPRARFSNTSTTSFGDGDAWISR